VLRFGLSGNVLDEERRSILALLLKIRPMLEDSYLRVAVATECARDREFVLTTDQGRSIMRSGLRALAWLSADEAQLAEAREVLHAAQDATEQSIVVNVQDMLGVDSDTYRRADSGDRQALKRLVREVFTRRASVAALSSREPWTTWMLRMIASGGEQSICDLFGVIDEARKVGRLPPEQANALDELLEQFIGPGQVRAETADRVTAMFAPVPIERDVIALFLAHDRLASGAPDVTLGQIEQSIRLAEKIGSEAALTFFVGVWSQYAAQAGHLDDAISAASRALELATSLAGKDKEFEDRLGRTALLLAQLRKFAGQPAIAAAIETEYHEAIEAHLRRARDAGD
jgi:hypothetical protein